MKSKILRICISFLTVLMVFISLPVMNASAKKKTTSDGIKCEISGGEVTITDYIGDAENLAIPSSIDGYPVTSIGEYAFSSCDSLTSIEIPSGVTSIGEDAFEFCYSLTSIEIPSGVTSIGEGAFSCCSALKRMVVDKNNPVYDSRDNCNAIIETATNTLIAGCSKTEIPSSVTSIGNLAFFACSSLTSITIPESVTSIGVFVFSSCDSLTSIEIPEGVTSIGEYVFFFCNSLTSIEIPESVTSIGDDAFSFCDSLSDVYYEGGEQEWNSITVGNDNESLTEANIHFNSEMPKPQTEPQTEQESEQKTESKSEAESEGNVSSGMKTIGLVLIGIIALAALLMWMLIVKKAYRNKKAQL